MQPQAQLEIAELAQERQEIWSYLIQHYVVNDVAVAGLKRKLEELLHKLSYPDPQIKLVLHELAYLASYKKDHLAVKKLMLEAKMHGMNNFECALAESNCLFMAGRVVEARKILMGIDLSKAPSESLRVLANQCVFNGMFDFAASIYQRLDGPADRVQQNCLVAHQILSRSEVSDKQVTDRIQFLMDFVSRQYKVPFIIYDIFAEENEGILYRMTIRATPEQLALLDYELDCAMAETFSDKIDSLFSIGVMPHCPEIAHNAGSYYVSL